MFNIIFLQICPNCETTWDVICVCCQGFQEINRPVQDTDTHEEREEDLTLHFSLGDVKRALGEIRERLDDIRCGEVHFRHSGDILIAHGFLFNSS